nr:hypothetical protein [Actinomycetota bacterium]
QILEDSFKRLDTGLAGLVSSGKAGDAAKSFEQIKAKAAELKVPVEELVKKFPEYADALKTAEAATKTAAAEGKNLDGSLTDAGKSAEKAAAQSEELQKALEEIGLSADGTVVNLDKFTTALVNAGLLTLSARDATAKFDEAVDGLDGKIRDIMATQQAHGGVLNEAKTDLDLYSEAGRAANDVLADMMTKGIGAAKAMAANGESMPAVQDQLSKTYDQMVRTAMGFGLGKEEAEKLTGSILHIPPGVDVKTWMSDEAKRMAEQTKGAIEAIPPLKEVLINIREETHRIAYEQRVVDSGGNEPTGGGLYGSDRALGGRVRGYSGGGKLPSSGPGTERTDGFLGISSAGVPLARVDKDEWIINGRSSNRYDRELAAINAGTFPKMPGYANGGREYSAQQLGYAPFRSSPPSREGMHIDKVEINEQSDPRATFAEFARRTHALGA